MEAFQLTPEILAILLLSSLLGGFVDSIAGGGGIITVPALLAVGIPPHLALGTNKLQSSFGAITATINYWRGGVLRFRDVRNGMLWTALGAVTGAIGVQRLSADLLVTLIPFLLTAIFLYSLFNKKMGQENALPRMKSSLFYFIFGITLGFYDGFFGPGTGSFWTIALASLLGYNLVKATAHTKALNATSNVVSIIAFLSAGNVLMKVGLLMGLAQVVGAMIGSRLVMSSGTKFVRVFFLIVVGVTITKLFWQQYV